MSAPRPSLRQTLTLWYVGILAVVLCLFGGTLYLSMSGSLARHVDALLVSRAESVARALETFWQAERGTAMGAPGNWLGSPPSTTADALDANALPVLAARWHEKTRYLHATPHTRLILPNGQVFGAPDGFGALAAVVSAEPPVLPRPSFRTVTANGARFRVLSWPYIQGQHIRFFVQTATSLEPIEASLWRLRGWLLILVPLTLILASIVGWVLVSRVLRPIGRMVAQARRISAARLDARVDTPSTGDELEQLGLTLNDMLDRIERAFRRLRQFSAAASHELRTPLTAMKGELEVALRRTRDPREYQRVLNAHLSTINDMSHIVEDLLALARHEVVNGALEMQSVDLTSLVRRTSELWRRIAQPKCVEVRIVAPEPIWVRGEPRLLERLIANVLDNAIRHTPPNGWVEARVEHQGSEARLTIQDTGPGIPPEELPRIFDRFFQRQTSSDGHGATTGLGLGLCRWIAEAHHGRIMVESQVGHGSTFAIALPLHQLNAAVPP